MYLPRRQFLRLSTKFSSSLVLGSVLARPAVVRAKELTRKEREKMIGSLIVTGFHGKHLDAANVREIRTEFRKGLRGGVMYLGRNVENIAQLKTMNTAMLDDYSQALIALDQEGGKVRRLREEHGFSYLPSPYEMAQKYVPREAYRIYKRQFRAVRAAGFTLNFAPCVDIHVPGNPVIAKYQRAFSKDPNRVSQFAAILIRAAQEENLRTSVKHFPGHGSSRTDSHNGFVDITNSWSREELIPYENLNIQNMIDMVMVSHVYHGRFCNDNMPISMAKDGIKSLLRKRLGFDGPVVSDDMLMGAVANVEPDVREACLLTLNADVDILLLSDSSFKLGENSVATAPSLVSYISKAISDGRLSEERLITAYKRRHTVK